MYTNPKFYKYQWQGIPVAGLDVNDRTDDIVGELSRNGAYCPRVIHVTTATQTTDKRAKLGKDGKPLKDPHGNPICETFKLETPVYTTIVEFEDNSKCIMKCSAHDKPDTETAIVNAIAKRIFGTPDPTTGVVSGNGFGMYMKKLAKKAFDQTANDANQKKLKAEAKAKHEAKQAADHEAAVKRAVSRKAKELKIFLEALKQLGVDVPLNQPKENKQILNEACDPCSENNNPCSYKEETTQEYVRPNKKFSEFTSDEKRAYWRAQKRGAL